MSKKRTAAQLEADCATYRLALEWYASRIAERKCDLLSDGGVRARLVLSTLDAGKELLGRLRDLGSEAARLRSAAAAWEARSALPGAVEPAELTAWRATATRYERAWRQALHWLKDLFGHNDFERAAFDHRQALHELHRLRRRLALTPDTRFSFLPGLAEQAAPRLLDALAGLTADLEQE